MAGFWKFNTSVLDEKSIQDQILVTLTRLTLVRLLLIIEIGITKI